MTIRAVVFDVGGVLELVPDMDFDRRWEERLGLEAGAIGTRLLEFWAGGAVGTCSEEEVRRAVGDRLGLDDALADELMADMWEQYLGVANGELIEYARGLRPRYRMGILSNSFVGARERERAAYGFEHLVDDIVYSHEVGLLKPDPGVYELTCRRLGVRPGETVFLDDDATAVSGARDAGIHAVLFRDNAQAIAEIGALLASDGVRGDEGGGVGHGEGAAQGVERLGGG